VTVATSQHQAAFHQRASILRPVREYVALDQPRNRGQSPLDHDSRRASGRPHRRSADDVFLPIGRGRGGNGVLGRC
jgi:hypothetical protein